MNDHELLEQAAKAAKLTILGSTPSHPGLDVCDEYRNDARRWWSPLTDDGDALRLAVKLGISIGTGVVSCRVAHRQGVIEEHYPVDATSNLPSMDTAMPAVRRAIVSVAAEIGRNTTA